MAAHQRAAFTFILREPMFDGWHRVLCDLLSRVYYRRVSLVELGDRRERRGGPVLYAGLHRNGAVDGMIYKRIFPRATFLISSQLTRSWFGRVFFTGIPVARARDVGDRSMNLAALDRCVAHLVAGGELFVFPEGTSDLGPRHLPFKPGVARILERALAAGADVRVVPVGIFYSAADAFRSDVTVVCGPAVQTDLPSHMGERERASLLMSRIAGALESIAVDMRTPAELAAAERLAALGAGPAGGRYYEKLKALQWSALPPHADAAWSRVQRAVESGELATDRGVPAVSRRGYVWNAGWLCLQAALTAAAAIVNAPVIATAFVGARRRSDARNTIALWRLLFGATAAAAWTALLALMLSLTSHAIWLIGYAVLTIAGLVVYPELRARWPRFVNRRASTATLDALAIVSDWVAHV